MVSRNSQNSPNPDSAKSKPGVEPPPQHTIGESSRPIPDPCHSSELSPPTGNLRDLVGRRPIESQKKKRRKIGAHSWLRPPVCLSQCHEICRNRHFPPFIPYFREACPRGNVGRNSRPLPARWKVAPESTRFEVVPEGSPYSTKSMRPQLLQFTVCRPPLHPLA